MLPFPHGVFANTKALKGLKEYLESNYNFQLIKTRRQMMKLFRRPNLIWTMWTLSNAKHFLSRMG